MVYLFYFRLFLSSCPSTRNTSMRLPSQPLTLTRTPLTALAHGKRMRMPAKTATVQRTIAARSVSACVNPSFSPIDTNPEFMGFLVVRPRSSRLRNRKSGENGHADVTQLHRLRGHERPFSLQTRPKRPRPAALREPPFPPCEISLSLAPRLVLSATRLRRIIYSAALGARARDDGVRQRANVLEPRR